MAYSTCVPLEIEALYIFESVRLHVSHKGVYECVLQSSDYVVGSAFMCVCVCMIACVIVFQQMR